jgi:hypothetical protein
VVRQAIRFNEPLPDRIANRPELMFGLELFYVAWFDLDSEREVGFGLGPIKRSAIVAYAEEYGFSEEQKEDLLYLVREMDNDYLARQAKKKPSKGGRRGDKDPPGSSE